jgi:Tfp pilus assembly protein PilF
VLKAGFAIDLRNGELAILTGLVALDLGDEKVAERSLLAAATMPRKDDGPPVDRAGALYHLANMALTHNDALRAKRWIEKALAEDPTHAGALELRERFGPESERPSRKAAR